MKAAGLSTSHAVAAMMVVLTMAVFTVEPIQAAITCSEVRWTLFPCLSYATGKVASPSNECSNQVRNLNSQSRTDPEDRRAACKCVKELAIAQFRVLGMTEPPNSPNNVALKSTPTRTVTAFISRED